MPVSISPVGPDDPVETMRILTRRSHDTQRNTETTLDRVDGLRIELGGRIDQLDAQIAEVAVGSARVEGKLDILVGAVSRSLDAQSQGHISAITARIEMERTDQLASINARRERWKLAQNVIIKAIAGIGVAWAAIATAIAKGC
jgi:hypothetical protein